MKNISLTLNQIEKMQHCIGLNKFLEFDKRKGQNKYVVYRNHYANGYQTNPELDKIVETGLMKSWTKMGNNQTYYYYRVSEKGLEFLGRMFNLTITVGD